MFVSIRAGWHSEYTALKEKSEAVLVPLQFCEKICPTVQCLEYKNLVHLTNQISNFHVILSPYKVSI